MEKIILILLAICYVVLFILYLKYSLRIYKFIYKYLKVFIPNNYLKKITSLVISFVMPIIFTSLPLLTILQTYLMYKQNSLIIEQIIRDDKKEITSNLSDLNIIIKADNLFSDIIFLEKRKDRNSYYYYIKYKILITNLGKKDTSIIDYGIYSKYNANNENNYFPLDLFFKPRLLTFSGNDLYFPLNIKSGESIGFHLEIRKELMPYQYDQIKEILVENQTTLKGIFLLHLSKIEEQNTVDSNDVIAFEGIDSKKLEIDIPKDINSNIYKDSNYNIHKMDIEDIYEKNFKK